MQVKNALAYYAEAKIARLHVKNTSLICQSVIYDRGFFIYRCVSQVLPVKKTLAYNAESGVILQKRSLVQARKCNA
jgi:hypothetical protein